MEPSRDKALVVMVKAPIPGQVKTRLTPPLSPEDAAGLYRCFIEDTLSRVRILQGVFLFVAYTPSDKEVHIKGLIPGNFHLIPQVGNDLGERLFNVFQRFFSMGYKKVVIIGSDSPDIPLEYIEMAFQALDDKGVVLGPSEDGGYYLIAMSLGTGLNSISMAIFKDIPWGSSRVLEETLKRARKNHIEASLLPIWYDIDTPGDIKRLKDTTLPRTSRFVGRFLQTYHPLFDKP